MKVIVKVNGKDIKEMTDEEKLELANALNNQALLTSGYRKAKKKDEEGYYEKSKKRNALPTKANIS